MIEFVAKTPCRINMLVIIAVFVSICGALIIYEARGGRRANDLGWMSAQWLAEYRASHLA